MQREQLRLGDTEHFAQVGGFGLLVFEEPLIVADAGTLFADLLLVEADGVPMSGGLGGTTRRSILSLPLSCGEQTISTLSDGIGHERAERNLKEVGNPFEQVPLHGAPALHEHRHPPTALAEMGGQLAAGLLLEREVVLDLAAQRVEAGVVRHPAYYRNVTDS